MSPLAGSMDCFAFVWLHYREIFSYQLQLPTRCRCLGGKPSRVVWRPTHTLGLKRIVISESAALFTDSPQMHVEHWLVGTIS
jgi:hypothetical protein